MNEAARERAAYPHTKDYSLAPPSDAAGSRPDRPGVRGRDLGPIPPEGEAWSKDRERLAGWVGDHLVNRTDIYGR